MHIITSNITFQDIADGTSLEVPCYMLDPLIDAFLLVSNLPANATIDLLALDTSAGDVFILEKMEKARIKVMKSFV